MMNATNELKKLHKRFGKQRVHEIWVYWCNYMIHHQKNHSDDWCIKEAVRRTGEYLRCPERYPYIDIPTLSTQEPK